MIDPYKLLNHFNRNERWGDPDKINPVLLMLVDKLRMYLDKPLVVMSGFATKGHSKDSQHYKGLALDLACPKSSYLEFVNEVHGFLTQFKIDDQVGLGIYPEKLIIHIDIRGWKARWGQIKTIVDGKEVFEYVGIDIAYKAIND